MSVQDPVGGSLPSGWELLTIGEICDKFAGEVQTGPFGSQLHAGDYVANGIPYVMPKDIIDGCISAETVARVSAQDASRLATHRLQAGDILYARRGDIGRRALVTSREEGWLCGTGCLRIRTSCPRLASNYLTTYLGHPAVREWVEDRAQGATLLNLNTTILRGVPVRIPPPEEQRRIANVLDKADAIRRKRKEAITLTEELLRSVFLEMFGNPVTNPKGWPVKKIGEAVRRFEAGTSVNGEPRARDSDGFGVLKISAVTSGVFRPEEHKAVDPRSVPSTIIVPRRGDLLFSRANTRELVAATCLVEVAQPHLFLPDKLWRVVPSNAVTNEYLRYLLGHSGFRTELTKRATGTSGSMLNVSMEKINALEAPIPPRAHQDRFSAVVWRSYELRNNLNCAHSQAEALFSSLVHRAFRGELTAPSSSKTAASTPKQLSFLE